MFRCGLAANEFIDTYVANGEYVKVYLLCVRHQEDITIELIADALNRTESDVPEPSLIGRRRVNATGTEQGSPWFGAGHLVRKRTLARAQDGGQASVTDFRASQAFLRESRAAGVADVRGLAGIAWRSAGSKNRLGVRNRQVSERTGRSPGARV